MPSQNVSPDAKPDQSTQIKGSKGANADFEIKCWGGDWGLPSIDPNCLSVIAYGHLAKAAMDVQPSLPKYTITGVMPELQMGGFVYSQAFSIFGIFRRDGYNADYHLSANQHADTFAFLSYVEQKLKPALLYNLWMDTANFTQVTRPAYAKACGLPWSLWYPRKLRQTVMDQLTQTYEGYRGNMAELEKFVYKNAFECLNVLEKKLGNQSYFFGSSPSTMDAVIYGHLGILLRAPLVSTGLQNHLNTCEKLKNLCFRIEKSFTKYPSENIRSSSPSSQPNGKSPIMKREQFVTLVSTVALMVAYVMTSGVLTSRRSRLAHKLGTVEDSPKRFHEVPVQLDDDDDE